MKGRNGLNSNSSANSPKIKFSRSRPLASKSVVLQIVDSSSPTYESFEVNLSYGFFFAETFNGRDYLVMYTYLIEL